MANDNVARDEQRVQSIFSAFGQSTRKSKSQQHQGKIVFRTDLMR